MSYYNMDHAGWVKQQLGRDLCEFEVKAFNILGIVGGGIYNAPINWKKLITGHRMVQVNWRGSLATWDFDRLSRLVALAHQACIRVELTPISNHYFHIAMWPRERQGGIAQRHPDLDALWDESERALPDWSPIRSPVSQQVMEGYFIQRQASNDHWAGPFANPEAVQRTIEVVDPGRKEGWLVQWMERLHVVTNTDWADFLSVVQSDQTEAFITRGSQTVVKKDEWDHLNAMINRVVAYWVRKYDKDVGLIPKGELVRLGPGEKFTTKPK